MEKFKTILVLNNEVEARLLDAVIPCLRRPPATTAGGDRVDSPKRYSEQILSIYRDLRADDKDT